ncbi:MAG: hypothetical protein IPJ37_16775 [Bacteroidales bacterium]|nr:hypothetical protein [Bacteroidales bacterium]
MLRCLITPNICGIYDYLNKNHTNLFLKVPLYLGYATALADNGDNYKALDVIQSILFAGREMGGKELIEKDLFKNPPLESIKVENFS